MKQPYISPATLTVAFGITSIIAVSAPDIKTTPDATPVTGNELDVKENKNVWDEEW